MRTETKVIPHESPNRPYMVRCIKQCESITERRTKVNTIQFTTTFEVGDVLSLAHYNQTFGDWDYDPEFWEPVKD